MELPASDTSDNRRASTGTVRYDSSSHIALRGAIWGTAWLLLVVAFFISIFCFYLSPISLGDFWWHLSTGRWIVENGAVPSHDPFTYTVPQDHDLRQLLILRGYWLAQVALYLTYTAFGFAGPIVLKAVIFTLIYLVLWKNLTMRGLDGFAALLVMAALPFVDTIFDEPRPQIFSFLGVVLIFNILEGTLERFRKGLHSGLALWIMPVFMMLWANIHRGYILGFMLITVYMLDEAVQKRLGRNALSVKDYRRFMGIAALSLASCLVNPNFTMAFAGNFVDLGSPFMKSIDELLPLRAFTSFNQATRLLYGTLGMFSLAALVIFVSRRRLRWHHLFLFSGFAFAGILSGRFSIFMLLMSLSIAARYIPERVLQFQSRLRPFLAVSVLVAVVLISHAAYGRDFVRRGRLDLSFAPSGAADFILSARPPAPLLNAFEYGGYLGWRLYPHYKLFIDQRNLDYPILQKFFTVRANEWSEIESVLDEYGINTVVFYPVNPGHQYVPGIILYALQKKSWQLLFFDRKTAVFVREDANPGLPVLEKQTLWDYLTQTAGRLQDENPQKIFPLLMLGSIYEAQANTQEALQQYRAALRLDPDNEAALNAVEKLTEGAGLIEKSTPGAF